MYLLDFMATLWNIKCIVCNLSLTIQRTAFIKVITNNCRRFKQRALFWVNTTDDKFMIHQSGITQTLIMFSFEYN